MVDEKSSASNLSTMGITWIHVSSLRLGRPFAHSWLQCNVCRRVPCSPLCFRKRLSSSRAAAAAATAAAPAASSTPAAPSTTLFCTSAPHCWSWKPPSPQRPSEEAAWKLRRRLAALLAKRGLTEGRGRRGVQQVTINHVIFPSCGFDGVASHGEPRQSFGPCIYGPLAASAK